MPIDGVSKIHMRASHSSPKLGGDGSGTIVKIGAFVAIVAVFGGAFYFISGRTSQSPVGAPATAQAAAPAADASAAKPADQAAAPAQPGATPVDQASAPQPTASVAPAQAAAAPTQPAAAAPADKSSAKDVAQSAPPADQAQPAQAAATQPAAPAAAPSAPASADVASASAPAEDAAPAAAPAPAHKAAHKKAQVAAAKSDEQAAAAAPAEIKRAEPDAVSVLNPWWQGADTQPFKITAVSPVKDQPALAVVFSEPVDASAGDHLKLLNNDGSAAAGSWAPGANPHVLVRNGVSPGRYMLFVDGAVASTDGKSLGSDMSGPVYVLAAR